MSVVDDNIKKEPQGRRSYTKLVLAYAGLFSLLVVSAPMLWAKGSSLMDTVHFLAWGHTRVEMGFPWRYAGIAMMLAGLVWPSRGGIIAGSCGLMIWCGTGWIIATANIT